MTAAECLFWIYFYRAFAVDFWRIFCAKNSATPIDVDRVETVLFPSFVPIFVLHRLDAVFVSDGVGQFADSAVHRRLVEQVGRAVAHNALRGLLEPIESNLAELRRHNIGHKIAALPETKCYFGVVHFSRFESQVASRKNW